MKVWISNRWETRGVYEQSVAREDGDRYVYAKRVNSFGGNSIGEQFRVGRDCFRTRAEAVVNARQRAERKVKALERQLAKVRKLAGEFA